MINLATQYLIDHNETRAEYDGLCGELANAVNKITPGSHIIAVSGLGLFHTTGWNTHIVVMVDGMIHDAWRKNVSSLERWLMKFDCEYQVELDVDGTTVFRGTASDFQGLSPLRRRLIKTAIARGC